MTTNMREKLRTWLSEMVKPAVFVVLLGLISTNIYQYYTYHQTNKLEHDKEAELSLQTGLQLQQKAKWLKSMMVQFEYTKQQIEDTKAELRKDLANMDRFDSQQSDAARDKANLD